MSINRIEKVENFLLRAVLAITNSSRLELL